MLFSYHYELNDFDVLDVCQPIVTAIPPRFRRLYLGVTEALQVRAGEQVQHYPRPCGLGGVS